MRIRGIAVTIATCAVTVLGTQTDAGERRSYRVDPAKSQVVIRVGRAGLFKFAGHEHEVLAPHFVGEIQTDGGDVGRARVDLTFEAAALRVTGKGEPPEDVPKVHARMIGGDVLDVARFPSVTFRSTAVTGRSSGEGIYDLSITGELTLHGVQRSMVVPVRVVLSAGTLQATGSIVLGQTDFGITPVSVAGVVKVQNELRIDFSIVAGDGVAVTAARPGD